MLTVIGNAYVLILALLLGIKALIGERLILLVIVNSGLHLLLMMAFIWLAVCLIRRRLIPAAVAALSVIYFVVFYGTLFLPRTVASISGTPIRLLTYNIHSEDTLFDPMIALIRQSNADIVLFQELSVQAAARFKTDLSADYPYQAFHADPDMPYIGQGILSRYPILSDDYWRNELPDTLGQLQVEININGTHLTLYNAHPIPAFLENEKLFLVEAHERELRSILDRAAKDQGPLLIAGDFNMTDQSDAYQEITARYHDSWRDVGWGLGFTFPDYSEPNAGPIALNFLRPLFRLDYVFHNDQVLPIEAHVWPNSGGSDHHPLFVQFLLSKYAEFSYSDRLGGSDQNLSR
jgi:endonuclease/exonuclease/phosphatase (EEP) superfamily protein YafD